MATTSLTKTRRVDTKDGYAIIDIQVSGAIDVAYYDHYDRLHRDDGPAEVYRSYLGQVYHYAYYVHGNPHREAGPAIVWKNVVENGLNTFRAGDAYYINGKHIPNECYELWKMFIQDPNPDNLESVLLQLSIVRPDISQNWWRRLADGDL